MSEDVLPAASGIGRVALRVADLDGVASFYEDVVGLYRLDERTVSGDGERVVLGAGGEELLVLLADPDAPPRDERAAGLFHLAVRVPDRAALGAALERLRAAGALEGTADHHVSEALYGSDPEGNGVEVYADRPREEWTFEGPRDGATGASGGSGAPARVRMTTERLDLADLAAASDGAASVPPGTDVGHVHLETTSLADARAFYVDALGTNVRATYGDSALFVAAGDYHHHVGLNTWRGRTEPAGDGRGLAWFEFVVPDERALEAAVERLRTAGVEVLEHPEDDPERAGDHVRVADPDRVELRLRAPD